MADSDAKGKGKARADDPQNPQLIRITNHGKITTWVAFALDFLDVSSFVRRESRVTSYLQFFKENEP
jgi:hypothetical protein